MSDLPSLTDLATQRLRANHGRDQMLLVAGVAGRVPTDRLGDPSTVTPSGEFFSRPEDAPTRNAARSRDHTLDAMEELADAANIISGQLWERLESEDLLRPEIGREVGAFCRALFDAERALRGLRAHLPESYRHDRSCVGRDEAGEVPA